MKSTLYRICSLLALLAVSASALAQAPSGYYSRLNGKTNAELKSTLRDIIYNHTQVSSYSDLPKYFQKTDVYPESNRWWDMYSDIVLYAPNFSGLNREHAFPKSWWGGSSSTPAYVDLYHLYPSEMKANSAKSNWPLGEVSNASTFDNGVVRVGTPVSGQGGGSTRVFEPNEEYKGDFARTYFYMVTCYSNLTWASQYSWMLRQGSYPTLQDWAITMLLRWNEEDPVSEKERNRQEEVYKVQGNRNPFIDRPELAEYIWGKHKNDVYNDETDVDADPALVSPAAGTTLDFNEVAVGSKTTSKLFIKTTAITSDLRVSVYQGDKDMFKLGAARIPYTSSNSSAGYWLDVTYQPGVIGEHNARLLISGGGMASSMGVGLHGKALEVPTLTTLTATEATDVDTDSYTANWNLPANDVVDYYIVTRSKHIGTNVITEELEAESNSLVVTDFSDSDYDTYSVQSSRLGYRSEPSNVITVRHTAGIDEIRLHEELELIPVDGGVMVICGYAHTSATVYDTLGRLVLTVPQLRDGMLISLPAGVYLFTTPRLAPVKMVVR